MCVADFLACDQTAMSLLTNNPPALPPLASVHVATQRQATPVETLTIRVRSQVRSLL